jgi:hypothetical protein
MLAWLDSRRNPRKTEDATAYVACGTFPHT